MGCILLFSMADLAQISTFMKIRVVGSELFHGDGRTDRKTDVTNPVVPVYNFPNAPNTLISAHVTNLYFYEDFGRKNCDYFRLLQ